MLLFLFLFTSGWRQGFVTIGDIEPLHTPSGDNPISGMHPNYDGRDARRYIVLSGLAGEHVIGDPPHSTRARVPAPHNPPVPHNPLTLSLIWNHARDLVRVGIAHQGRTAQFALPLLVLRGQDVAQVRVSPLYLSGGGLLEAFRRALM